MHRIVFIVEIECGASSCIKPGFFELFARQILLFDVADFPWPGCMLIVFLVSIPCRVSLTACVDNLVRLCGSQVSRDLGLICLFGTL